MVKSIHQAEKLTPPKGRCNPMNQTLTGAITPIGSAFDFLKSQVESYNQKQLKTKIKTSQLVRQLLAISVTLVLTTVTALPRPLGTEVRPTPEPVAKTEIRFDKTAYMALILDEPKIEIKPGKSLVEEQAEAKARSLALKKQSFPTLRATVKAASTEEAHRLAQEAAAKAGIPEYWKILASVWQVETGKAIQSCIVSKADGRAVGPMQFMPGTFRAYATDGDGDGHADICNAKDALVSAGKLLKRGGIDSGNVDGAIHNYNHSMAYVNKVKRIANSIN